MRTLRLNVKGLCLILVVALMLSGAHSGSVEFTEAADMDSVPCAAKCSDGIEQSNFSQQSQSNAPSNRGLMLWEVCSSFACELITLLNHGENSTDLKGISIADGEGQATFTDGVILESGEMLTLCTNLTMLRGMGIGGRAMELSDGRLEVKGTLRLADGGDEVMLLSMEGALMDAFVYGESDYQGAGWTGEPYGVLGRGNSAVRISVNDSDVALDWKDSVPGRSSFRPFTCSASLEPFVFPEDGGERILRELAWAKNLILLAVYSLNDPLLVSGLCCCSKRGVCVEVLLEGNPVGGIGEAEKGAIGHLLSEGVKVHLMESCDGFKRYGYLHCKYAIVDGLRVCIMSENMLSTSLRENRGWGVVIESKEVARFFTSMFELDSNPYMLDVVETTQQEFPAPSWPLEDISLPCPSVRKMRGEVRPVISPDFSLESLIGCLREGGERILLQPLYIRLDSDHPLINELLQSARRGVQVRILMDSSFFTEGEGNGEMVAFLNNQAALEHLDLEAKLVSEYHNFSLMHNKGLIVDDMTLVSSINWCDSAIEENRETGIMVFSEELTSFFASVFWKDWEDDPLPPTASIEGPAEITEGDLICLSASNSSDNAGIIDYSWSLEGEESTWEGPFLVTRLPVGTHTFVLEVTDLFGNTAEDMWTIEVVSREGGEADLRPLAALLVAPPLLVWFLKKVKMR